MSTSRKHDWLQDKIYTHPEIARISPDSIISKSKEKALLYKGHLYVVPDLYFLTSTSEELIEVKSDNSEFLYTKGMRQLEKILKWHEIHDLDVPISRLVMPSYSKGKSSEWIDLLYDLKYYELGDSFKSPRYFN